MLTSTDINLPITQTPVFPDACVVCGQTAPGNKVKIGTNAIGWWTWLLWAFGRRFSVRVPACKGCAVKLQLRRWGGHIVCLVLAFLVLMVIEPIVSPLVPAPLRKWALMISLLLCLVPYFAWEVFFPSAIELTAYSDSVDYEFRDLMYAFQFVLLNKEPFDDDPETGDLVDDGDSNDEDYDST